MIKGAEIPRRSSSFLAVGLDLSTRVEEKRGEKWSQDAGSAWARQGCACQFASQNHQIGMCGMDASGPTSFRQCFFSPEWQRSVKKCLSMAGHVSNRKPQEVFGGGRRKTLWDQWPLAAGTRVSHRGTDKFKFKQTDRQIDRQAHLQTDRQTDRQKREMKQNAEPLVTFIAHRLVKNIKQTRLSASLSRQTGT